MPRAVPDTPEFRARVIARAKMCPKQSYTQIGSYFGVGSARIKRILEAVGLGRDLREFGLLKINQSLRKVVPPKRRVQLKL